MSAELDRCRSATMASLEVVLEECEGRDGRIGEVGDNVFTFIPDGALPFEPGEVDLDDDDAVAEAIEACMESDYATDVAEGLVGDRLGRRNTRHVRRSLCEQLVS